MRRALVLALALFAVPATAQPIQPFIAGSHAQILALHRDRPLILAFWSLTCAHCQEEFALLREFTRAHPEVALALVSTDTPQDSEAIAATLRARGLDTVPAWVFADDMPERLRFEVDRRWRGELPRTYLHRPNRSVQALSGKLERKTLEDWLGR
jgi:thiol-disulfide isomerase/thioredoxin